MTVSELDAQTEAERAFIRDKADRDMKTRLDEFSGQPKDPKNDYSLHLYARRLRLLGYNRDGVRLALQGMDMSHIPANKVNKYLSDIINSIIVGFPGERKCLMTIGENLQEQRTPITPQTMYGAMAKRAQGDEVVQGVVR